MQADELRVPVGPGAMHVERYGHGGTAVILIHGFATSSFLWRNVAPGITDAGHTAYAVDLFGHGESDRPFDADFGIAAQAEYLDAAMTALRVARGVLVGVDLGADIAVRLAATRPERVEKLVLINPPVFESASRQGLHPAAANTGALLFARPAGFSGRPLIGQYSKSVQIRRILQTIWSRATRPILGRRRTPASSRQLDQRVGSRRSTCAASVPALGCVAKTFLRRGRVAEKLTNACLMAPRGCRSRALLARKPRRLVDATDSEKPRSLDSAIKNLHAPTTPRH